MKTCSVENCGKPYIARGFCQNHYRVFMRRGTPTPYVPTEPERWLSYVKVQADGCWLFAGALNTYGYGTMQFRGRQDVAHRIAWTLEHGEIPDGQCVLHRCDVRACCNPAHLFLGDLTANNRDMTEKGRQKNVKKTHCIRGHPLGGDNLLLHKHGNIIARVCRTCKRMNERKYKRNRAA